MKKKLMVIGILCAFLVLFTACVATPKSTMKIQSAEFTEEQTELLALLGVNTTSKLYDYTIDDTIKTVKFDFYTLDSNLKWKEDGGFSTQVDSDSPTGKIILSNPDINGNIRIAWKNEKGVSTWNSASKVYKHTDGLSSSISWGETTEIIPEQEIPLAIQIFTDKDSFSGYDASSFYDTDKLKDHNVVTAVTVTFSKHTMDELNETK